MEALTAMPVPPQQMPENLAPQEHVWDIIDEIEANFGRIRGKKSAKEGSEAFYSDAYEQARGHAAVRRVLSNTRGQSPDEMADALRRSGKVPEGFTVDDLWDRLIQAAQARKGKQSTRGEETTLVQQEAKQAETFAAAAFHPPGGTKSEPVPVSNLIEGDEFSLAGTKVKVKELVLDGDDVAYVVLEDGRKFGTQTVNAQQVIQADQGSYKPAAREAGFEPMRGAALAAPPEGVTAFLKDVPPNLLEAREKAIQKAQSEGLQVNQLNAVEAAISAIDNRWSMVALDEALRHSRHGSGAVEYLQSVATSDDRTQKPVIDRAKQILEHLPQDRATRTLLERSYEPTAYDDLLLKTGDADAKVVLEAIQKNTKSPWYRELTGLLIERGVNPNVRTFKTLAEARAFIRANPEARGLADTLGYTHYATDTVFLVGLDRIAASGRSVESIALHETVHSGTITAFQDSAFSAAVQKILHDLWEIDGSQRFYGVDDPHELVAESFANDEFRAFLEAAPYGQGTFLSTLMDLVTPRIQPNSVRVEGGAAVVAKTPAVGERGLIRGEIEGQRDFEEATQNAQVSTLLDLLEKHGTSPANPILQLLEYGELLQIQNQTGSARQTYEQFKAANPEAAYLPAVALEASLKLVLERNKWRELRKRLADQEALIQSKGFQGKIAKMEAKEIQKDALDTAWQNFRVSIKDAIEETKQALQGEAGNDVRAEQLLRSISSLESIEGYQVAMEHAVEKMVNAIAQNPQAAQFIAQTNPSAQAIVDEYQRIREELGDNPAASEIVITWAGELLSRSWVEAQRMVLSAMVRDNLKLQKDMTAYERAVFKGIRDKPRSTVEKILSTARKTSKASALTQLAWSRLRREVSRELEEWDQLQQAADIADKVESDPDFKKHANTVFKDAKIEDRPNAVVRVGNQNVSVSDLEYDAIAGNPIFPMPDGTLVQVHLVGDAKAFDAERKKMEAALEQLRDWKEAQDALPADQRDPSYNFFVGHLKALEFIYLGTRVTHPSSLVSIGNPFSGEQPGSWGMPTFLLDDLGTRVGGAAKVAASNFNRVHFLAHNLLVRQHELHNAQSAAAASYQFTGRRSERAIQLYDHVLQPLFAAAQRPGFKLQAGMVVGQGYKVTKEVVALLRLQRDLAEQAFRIVQEQVPKERPTSAFSPVIEDFINGVSFHGEAIKVNDTTLPFDSFNERAMSFVQDYLEKKRRGDSQGAIDTLLRNYEFLFSYLADRASITETGPSPYENAYKLLVQRLQANPPRSAQRNLKWIAQEISAINGVPPDEVAGRLIGELDAVLEHVAAMRQVEQERDPTVSVSQPHQKSSFTARRHDRNVPYYFVRYGFRTGANFLNFIGNVHTHSFQRFIEALGEVQRDLERQRDDLSVRYDQRLQELISSGTTEPKAKKQAVSDVKRANALAHLNGQTTDQFRSLKKRVDLVKKTIKSQKELFTGNREAELDISTWRRISRATVGSLLTGVPTLIRNAVGLAYPGSAMARMRRNAAISSVDVTARLIWDGLVKQGVAVPVFKALKYAMGRGGLKPWFEAMHDRLDRHKRLEDVGLVSPIDVPNEFMAKLRNLENAGIVLDDRRGAAERAVLTLVGLFDAFLLTAVAKPLLPRLGDTIINAASDSATVAMVKELENRLRDLFSTWSDAGRLDTRFDFTNATAAQNVLSHDEIFPGMFGTSSRQKLEYLRQLFEWSGTTFDRAAFDFLQKLRAGQTDAQLLNNEQMIGVKDQVLGQVNVPHALNRPAWTHSRDIFPSLFAPLAGWNIHTARQFYRYFSRPGVAPGESRVAMWFVMGMVLLPVLLAMMATQDVGTEELIRLLFRGMGKERSTRQPWEQPPDRVAQALLVSALNPVPYLSMFVNAALNDSPNRASFDPTPVLINKAKDIATYIGGVIQTGNPEYGLERVISSLVPMVAPLLARMPTQEGVQDALNARRLLSRHGDPDMLRPRYTGAGPATPLTPFGQQMLNAAMKGDDVEFQQAYDAAVGQARAMGKQNPEAVVQAIFSAQNPYSRAFKQKLTHEQRSELLAKLDPRERAIVERAEQQFSRAGAMIGAEPTFEKQPSRGGGTLGGTFALRRSRSIRRGRAARPRRGRRASLSRGRRGRRRSGLRRVSRGLRRY